MKHMQNPTVENEKPVYLIEDVIKFSPAERTFLSLTTGEKVTILASAAECLEHLIRSQGQLATKDTMKYVGWGKYNLHVSDNTFYQNILTLRKGLRKCGLEKEVIKTIPRKGLIVPKEIVITNPAADAPLNTIPEASTDIATPIPPFIQEQPPDTIDDFQYSAKKNGIYKTIFLIYLPLTLLGLTLGSYLAYPTDYMADYQSVGIVNGCEASFDKLRATEQELQHFLKSNSFDCRKNNQIYFSTYQYVPRISLFQCSRKFQIFQHNDCTSFYYLEN